MVPFDFKILHFVHDIHMTPFARGEGEFCFIFQIPFIAYLWLFHIPYETLFSVLWICIHSNVHLNKPPILKSYTKPTILVVLSERKHPFKCLHRKEYLFLLLWNSVTQPDELCSSVCCKYLWTDLSFLCFKW